MLEELQGRNYAETTTRHYIQTLEDFAQRFNCPPDRLGSRHIREYQAELFLEAEIVAEFSHPTSGGAAILLRQDTQAFLEHCRNSLSEMGVSSANDS